MSDRPLSERINTTIPASEDYAGDVEIGDYTLQQWRDDAAKLEAERDELEEELMILRGEVESRQAAIRDGRGDDE